ncbi:MAG: autophagy protein [Chaenotheca gracillima]|nr:MAG: autophagy protein [Chaenotheca gracillima]
MAAVIARPPQFRQSPTPPPMTPALQLNTARCTVPNKHLQPLSPGKPPVRVPETPPASPPSRQLSIQTSSILHPPNAYPPLFDTPKVYSIDADSLTAAVEHIGSQPLPEPKQVFPWLHGLHPENQVQLAFFTPRRRSPRRKPACMRGITIVKAGGDLTHSKLKGAVAPEELLPEPPDTEASFAEVDPREGFSVRNFQIQVGKLAMVSDVVIYGDDDTPQRDVFRLAKRVSKAQALLQSSESGEGRAPAPFSTFVLSSPFKALERGYPELVATDSKGQSTGAVLDFFTQERLEMCEMTRASEICQNVWLGPTPDPSFPDSSAAAEGDGSYFDFFIEANDLACLPEQSTLKMRSEAFDRTGEAQHVEFPSAGSVMPPSWTEPELESIVKTCRWIYEAAHPEARPESPDHTDEDGDSQMSSGPARAHRVLIHCTDGYTESTLLALIYYMFAEGVPIHEAWLQLHCDKKRNFFAYPSDVILLQSIQARILQESPKQNPQNPRMTIAEPSWLARMDGSFPSRVLPYMYLGNLGHANNPELLRALGIGQVLSVGEPVSWTDEDVTNWGENRLMLVDRVQDNGVDPLTEEFSRCLEFIEQGKQNGTATLVHCRVGVSRSATICIAEVMKTMKMSFPRAYCFVRARRLNVIIQPHLRFAYELLKWEEVQQAQRRTPLKRELEWATIAREIALMNRPYSSR